MLRNMQELTARNILIMSTVLTLFAAVIAVGVVYNNARIALAERTWELASLRVLGFTRAEVSGAAAGRARRSASRWRCRWACSLGCGLVHLIARPAAVRPVPVSGGDPAAHLRLAALCRDRWPRRPAHWSCAGASTGSTWSRR